MVLCWDLDATETKKRKSIGLFLMFLAGLFLSLGNTLFQSVVMDSLTHGGPRVTSAQMLIVRGAVQLLFSTLIMIYRKIHYYGNDKKNFLPLLAMGLAEVCVTIFLYEAEERMAVGDVTVLTFTAPVFTSLLSFIILKTRLRLFDGLFGIISFVGVVFIAKPFLLFPNDASITQAVTANSTILTKSNMMSHYTWTGSVFAILSAVSMAVFFTLNKITGYNSDVILTIFYPSIMALVVGPVVMVIRQETFYLSSIKGQHWGIMITVGFVSFIGLMLIGESLQLQDPGPANLIRNCDVIIVYILQYLLCDLVPTRSSAIGTVLIICCSSLIILNHSLNLDKNCCGNDEDDETRKLIGDDDEGTAFLMEGNAPIGNEKEEEGGEGGGGGNEKLIKGH